MHIPLNRLGIEWNSCEQGKGRIRFYNVETEKADRSLRKSAGAVESWWLEQKPNDLQLTIGFYRALCYALIDGVDRTLINGELADKVGDILHNEGGEYYFVRMPTYYQPLPPSLPYSGPVPPRYSTDAMLDSLRSHAC